MIHEQILGERKNDHHLPKIYGKLHGSEPNTHSLPMKLQLARGFPGERRLGSKAFYMIPFEAFVIMFKLSCCSY